MTKIDFAISLLVRVRDFGLSYNANRIPATACAAMMVLAKAGDWMKGTDLGRELGINPSSFSRFMLEVEEFGLVGRRDSLLGRSNGFDWRLTLAGEQAVAKMLSDPKSNPEPAAIA